MSSALNTFRCCSLIALALVPSPAAAGDKSSAGLRVQGTAAVSAPATTVRLSMEVLAQGDDLSAAVRTMNEQTRNVRQHLVKWGAKPETIQFESPGLATSRFAAPSTAELLPVAAVDAESGPLPATELSPHIRPILTSLLSVDFPLDSAGRDAHDLLIVEQLKDKIAGTDLAGLLQLDAGVACQSCGPQPGVPMFLFVRRVSEDERAAALAAAFSKARRSAMLLAQAAGGKLGDVRAIEEPLDATSADEFLSADPARGPLAAPVGGDRDDEIAGASSDLVYRVSLQAAFELLPGQSGSLSARAARR